MTNDTFEHEYPFGTDIEGRMLYVADGQQRWLLVEFDFSFMWRSTCLAWRRAVSAATGIPAGAIWIHTNQSHTAPCARDVDGEACERLVALCLPTIGDMIARADEAELSWAVVDLDGQFNFNREVFVPELGAVTAWGGALQTDTPGPPYTQDPDQLLLCGYRPPIPAFDEPILFDRYCDPQAALLVFRRAGADDVLGSLIRFSGHPDVAGGGTGWGKRPEQCRYDYDWPGYARNALDTALGGASVCVGGPCGNVAMRHTQVQTYEEAAGRARTLGEELATACVDAWRAGGPEWSPLSLGPAAAADVDLPLRDAVPKCRADVPVGDAQKQLSQKLWDEFDAAKERNERPTRIKRMADEMQFTNCLEAFVIAHTNLTDDELSRRVMTVALQAVRLNDLVLAGFPGETMTETSLRLQARTIGPRLVTLDQVNGYHLYMANDDAHTEGGYSYWGSLTARGAEPMLRNEALKLIRAVC